MRDANLVSARRFACERVLRECPLSDVFEFRYAQNRPPLPLIPRCLPDVPEINLYLFPDALPQDKVSQADFYTLMANPPYWAFCWGGGQALARFLLDHASYVAGRCVWDFGAGSGVAGIAALQAGATLSVAVDTDPTALEMAQLNAKLNGVGPVQVMDVCIPRCGDVVLAADICYEEAGLQQVRAWAEAGVTVLVAESRLQEDRLGVSGLQCLAVCRVRTFPDLEEAEQFDQVFIYRVNA